MEEKYLGFIILDLMELNSKLRELSLKYAKEKDEANSERYGRMCDECESLLKSLNNLCPTKIQR